MSGKTAGRGYIQAQLECGHIVRVSVRSDDIALCPFDSWQLITSRWEREWRWDCRACRTVRWLGQDKEAAHGGAARHVERHPSHAVSVRYVRVNPLNLPRG